MQAGLMARTHKPPTLGRRIRDDDVESECERERERIRKGKRAREREKNARRKKEKNERERERQRGDKRRKKRAIGVFTVFPRRHTGTGVYARHPQKRTL